MVAVTRSLTVHLCQIYKTGRHIRYGGARREKPDDLDGVIAEMLQHRGR